MCSVALLVLMSAGTVVGRHVTWSRRLLTGRVRDAPECRKPHPAILTSTDEILGMDRVLAEMALTPADPSGSPVLGTSWQNSSTGRGRA